MKKFFRWAYNLNPNTWKYIFPVAYLVAVPIVYLDMRDKGQFNLLTFSIAALIAPFFGAIIYLPMAIFFRFTENLEKKLKKRLGINEESELQ
jgi:hypothetical protein